jgi:hypothetical protein
VSTAIRLYLGWRLLRVLRPLLCATIIIAAVFASHLNNATPNRSAAAALKGGAVAARLDLPRALQRAFQPAHHRP